VTEDDVNAVLGLYDAYSMSEGYDEETGTIDSYKLKGGRTQKIIQMKSVFQFLFEDMEKKSPDELVEEEEFVRQFLAKGYSEQDFSTLRRNYEALIYSPKNLFLKRVAKRW